MCFSKVINGCFKYKIIEKVCPDKCNIEDDVIGYQTSKSDGIEDDAFSRYWLSPD